MGVLAAQTIEVPSWAFLMDSYHTDVRPLLADLRRNQGLDPDPMAAYAGSGYAERITVERTGGHQAGWGA